MNTMLFPGNYPASHQSIRLAFQHFSEANELASLVLFCSQRLLSYGSRKPSEGIGRYRKVSEGRRVKPEGGFQRLDSGWRLAPAPIPERLDTAPGESRRRHKTICTSYHLIQTCSALTPSATLLPCLQCSAFRRSMPAAFSVVLCSSIRPRPVSLPHSLTVDSFNSTQ